MGRYVISYSRHDGPDFPLMLYDALLEEADVDPWIDVRNDPEHSASVSDVIARSEGLVLVLPTTEADPLSRSEIQFAEEYHKPLIQVRADESARPL